MLGSYEHEVRVAGGSGHVQNLVFLGFKGHNVVFFIFHAEADTCWSARCARSGLVVSNSIIFFRFMGKFIKKAYIRVIFVNHVILGYFGSFRVLFVYLLAAS